MLKYTVAW